jgi:hypothetical protein
MSFHSLENITPAAINKDKQPINGSGAKLMIRLVFLIVIGLFKSVVSAAPLVSYDFTAGDTGAPKQGFTFGQADWTIPTIPGTSIKGMNFLFYGVPPFEDRIVQQNFYFPPRDQFWFYFRLYIPANYVHRTDTYLQVGPGAQGFGWQVGDSIVGSDGVTSGGTISGFASDGVYLRNAKLNNRNDIWEGTITNATRNTTRNSTQRLTDSTNNKLLAIWTDGYSGEGLGPTVVWEFWAADLNVVPYVAGSDLCVHYARGNHTGASAHEGCGQFIVNSDRGKYIDIMVYVKFTTAPGANNGIITTWLRKQGQVNYSQMSNVTNADIDKKGTDANPGQLVSWNQGYLMGHSNSGYDEDTEFFISKVEYFDADPFGSGQPVEVLPSAPTYFRIK